MKHERADYNERVKCVDGSIPENEPVFLLRGKDPFAQQVVEYWVFLHRHRKSLEVKRERVLAHAQKMYEYERDLTDTGCTS